MLREVEQLEGESSSQAQIGSIGVMGVMKRDGSVGSAVQKLTYERIVGVAQFGNAAGRAYDPVCDQIHIFYDLHRFGGIVRNDD